MAPTQFRPAERPPPPSVPDLLVAPELAALSMLDVALEIVVAALLAEHITLIDDLREPGEHGPVVELADVICRRAASLRLVLARYARAARDASAPSSRDPTDDLPF
jgi:hypothetical protein